jgi:hypothetical protein
MGHWLNDTDRGLVKYWERDIILCRWEMNECIWCICGMILIGEN